MNVAGFVLGLGLFGFKYGDGFDVGGVGEHVHDAGGDEGVAVFVDEGMGIAGEGAGMAGDVDDAFGAHAGDVGY